MTLEFKKNFEIFFEGCQKIYDKYWEQMGFSHQKDEFSFSVGKKYVKVFYGGSVHSFVDMTNGNVLKPASWATPAKGSRGNIFDEKNGLGRMTAYGPQYNK